MPEHVNRRDFMVAVTAAIGGSALGQTAIQPARASSVGACDLDHVGDLVFHETSSLLDSNYNRLTDDNIVFVYSENTASAGSYSNEEVPLWARDGNYFGSGSLLVNDDDDNCLDYGQDAVLLNIIDSYTGGSGHIVYDESADQASNYTLDGDFSKFKTWVQGEGYSIEASQDLTEDLDSADALLITLPNEEHAADQVDAIQDFANAGNPVFLFNESNSWDTDDLNYLADQLDLAFRFDDDEVEDEPGWEWDDWPITRNYDSDSYPEWFSYRTSMGFDPGSTYQAVIDDVIDGDTFDVIHQGGYHDGEDDRIRHLGMDTAETGRTQNDSDEWRGIESTQYLDSWGGEATDYAEANFEEGDVITFWVDENEHPPRGLYGRLLAFHTYPEGHEKSDVNYNLDVVELGYAKPYNSSFAAHPEFKEAYWSAYEQGLRIWEEADAEATDEVWNRAVEALRFRGAKSIVSTSGSLGSDETAVWTNGGTPLVSVDEQNGVALVGGLMNADNWESGDDENFVFNANLAQRLSGDVEDDMLLIEGGHGQFAASYDFSFEGKEAYHRFIEGLDAMWFQSINELSAQYLDTSKGRHALVITPPDTGFCYTSDEVEALTSFIDDGGAVILKANTEVRPESVEVLNDLAAELGSDHRFNDDDLGDIETSSFNTSDFDFWSAYDTDHSGNGGGGGDDPASFSASIDTYDGEVTEGETVNVDYTVENTGDEDDTQDVVFTVDGTQEDVESGVSLDGGSTFSGTFSYTTVEGDAPEITVEVATEDDADQRNVTVNEEGDDGGAEADVLDADPDTAETESFHTWTLSDPSDDFDGEVDEITVEYPAETSFDGLTNEDVTVWMDRDGDGEVDEISVNSGEYAGSSATFDLDGRFNTHVEGEVRVEIDGVHNPTEGDYVATITLTGDDSHAVNAEFVVVEGDGSTDPASFSASIDTYDSEVTEGENVNVDYTIENTGDESDTQDVVFTVDGTQEDVESGVSLDGAGTFSGTFSYTTEDGDAPEITVEVATDDDVDQRDVTVNEEDDDDDGDCWPPGQC